MRYAMTLTVLALVQGTWACAAAQTGNPVFQPVQEGHHTSPALFLNKYLGARFKYTGRRPHVVVCTRIEAPDIAPPVYADLNREKYLVDSIWVEPSCPAELELREIIAGSKGPYELVRITTFSLGFDVSVIEAVVERAGSRGGVINQSFRERFLLEHNLTTDRQAQLQVTEILRLAH
jgi:hypothetical protein